MIEDKHVLYSGREDGRHTHGVALFCASFALKCMLTGNQLMKGCSMRDLWAEVPS